MTSPFFSTIWRFRPYKPYIFWKLMTPTIYWPTDHSPITHTDPPDLPNPSRTHLTWPFLHFKTFYAIQPKYFLKPHDIQTGWSSIHWLTEHSPITFTDPPSPTYGLLSLAQFTLSSSIHYSIQVSSVICTSSAVTGPGLFPELPHLPARRAIWRTQRGFQDIMEMRSAEKSLAWVHVPTANRIDCAMLKQTK